MSPGGALGGVTLQALKLCRAPLPLSLQSILPTVEAITRSARTQRTLLSSGLSSPLEQTWPKAT
jgi:hypothetical protein